MCRIIKYKNKKAVLNSTSLCVYFLTHEWMMIILSVYEMNFFLRLIYFGLVKASWYSRLTNALTILDRRPCWKFHKVHLLNFSDLGGAKRKAEYLMLYKHARQRVTGYPYFRLSFVRQSDFTMNFRQSGSLSEFQIIKNLLLNNPNPNDDKWARK